MNKYISGWVTNAWRKEDRDRQIIKLQYQFIIILVLISFGFFIGWMRAPSNLTIHIPPDIQNGATIKVGAIPSALIYSFTYQVWQELNFWPKNGEIDYKQNIEDHWSYLTPQFKQQLLADLDDLKITGQLQRVRYMQGMTGATYDVAYVKKLSADSWEVDLKMHLTEYKNTQVVKDVVILFPLKVSKMTISPTTNPYGFAIAGFAAEPTRLNSLI